MDQALLDEVIDTLERVDCQYKFCDGPTLTPVDMITCYRCETLAKVRHAAGRPSRLESELTADEARAIRDAAYMRSCVRR